MVDHGVQLGPGVHAVEAGELEVLIDDAAAHAKAGLVRTPGERYGLTAARA